MLLDTAKHLKNIVRHEFFISRCTLGQDIRTNLLNRCRGDEKNNKGIITKDTLILPHRFSSSSPQR